MMGNDSREKSLQLAIQLNLVFPGFGYFYIGQTAVGIAAILLVTGIYVTTALTYILHAYVGMNVIMAIHLFIWNRRRKKKNAAGQGMEK